MLKWICLKCKISRSPKRGCLGGYILSVFSRVLIRLIWKFFWVFFHKFLGQKIFFMTPRIFYARRIFYENTVFCKKRYFCLFLGYFEQFVKFRVILSTVGHNFRLAGLIQFFFASFDILRVFGVFYQHFTALEVPSKMLFSPLYKTTWYFGQFLLFRTILHSGSKGFNTS